MRYKLRFKIQRECKRFYDFANDIGISHQHLCNILQGTTYGSEKLWKRIQERLNIPDEEMESYRKNEENSEEEE